MHGGELEIATMRSLAVGALPPRPAGFRSLAATDGPLNLRHLADREWILCEPGHGLDDVVLFACATAGFTPRPAMRTGQAEAFAAVAAAHQPARPPRSIVFR